MKILKVVISLFLVTISARSIAAEKPSTFMAPPSDYYYVTPPASPNQPLELPVLPTPEFQPVASPAYSDHSEDYQTEFFGPFIDPMGNQYWKTSRHSPNMKDLRQEQIREEQKQMERNQTVKQRDREQEKKIKREMRDAAQPDIINYREAQEYRMMVPLGRAIERKHVSLRKKAKNK